MALYTVVDLKYPDGKQAVLRNVDGSGFAFYRSGRKAVCLSAHGWDGGRNAYRRFAAVIHADNSGSTVLGTIDEWGHGCVEAQRSADSSPGTAPTLLVRESDVTLLESDGRSSTWPNSLPSSPKTTGVPVVLTVNPQLQIHHSSRRTKLRFHGDGVEHSFSVGELLGEHPAGMQLAQDLPAAPTELSEMRKTLSDLMDKVSLLRVDPVQPKRLKDSKSSGLAASSPELALAGSSSLLGSKLKTAGAAEIRKLLQEQHPCCPGPPGPGGKPQKWTIGQVSGRLSLHRLAQVKPTVDMPVSLKEISQVRLQSLIDECASNNVLLVVICLATYSSAQSNYARQLAEKAHTELLKRFQSSAKQPPAQIVAVELSESGYLAKEFHVKEAPYCLMFQNGSVVYSKRLSGMKLLAKEAFSSRPHALLIESSPLLQLKLEKALRRCGCTSDLAFEVQQGLTLASQSRRYGLAVVSADVGAHAIGNIVTLLQQREPDARAIVYNAGKDKESFRALGSACMHVFPSLPSWTAISKLLPQMNLTNTGMIDAGDNKKAFLLDVLDMLDRGGGRTTNSLDLTVKTVWA
mmetsp:Transcript_35541/g.81424  ORF Transcript_35541/g.81424 Transcript_35541/m.81424 type:complete len:575 (-) Transcript_35541:52-1776(-)